MRLFRATESCPCCHLGGMVIALVRRDTSAGVYRCPACGLCWPGGGGFDLNADCDSIEVMAPAGVRLPEPDELPPDVVPVRPDDVVLWAPFIQQLLPSSPDR